jgi:hypothetical protein
MDEFNAPGNVGERFAKAGIAKKIGKILRR